MFNKLSTLKRMGARPFLTQPFRLFAAAPPPEFQYQELFEIENKPDVKWKKLTGDYVSTLTGADGREVL